MWTGRADPDLTPEGRIAASASALFIKDLKIDMAYTSPSKRCRETLDEIKKALGLTSLETYDPIELMERDYGDLTGKNKWEVKKHVGDDKFIRIRRGWDEPIPNGESLKDVYERIIPYYKLEIQPKLKNGKNILIVSSNNLLRSLMKYLENISDVDIATHEIGVGSIKTYEIDENGNVLNSKILNTTFVP